MLVNISASNIHILECSLHSNSFGTAYVSHRCVRHSRSTAWLRIVHDNLLECCYCRDKSGCVSTGLIVHLHVEISHRENECFQKNTVTLIIHDSGHTRKLQRAKETKCNIKRRACFQIRGKDHLEVTNSHKQYYKKCSLCIYLHKNTHKIISEDARLINSIPCFCRKTGPRGSHSRCPIS
jgi:hypothetical protein